MVTVPAGSHITPNYDFFTGGAQPLDVAFDFLAGGPYASFRIGSTQGNFGDNGPDGLGAIFNETGGGAIFLQGTNGFVTGISYTPVTTGLNHFDVVVTPNTGYDLLTITVNGTALGPGNAGLAAGSYRVGTGGQGSAFNAAYVTLSSDITQNKTYLFDNLAVTSLAAAPEPSQTAALGLGVLGLAGLILTARKRSRLSA